MVRVGQLRNATLGETGCGLQICQGSNTQQGTRNAHFRSLVILVMIYFSIKLQIHQPIALLFSENQACFIIIIHYRINNKTEKLRRSEILVELRLQ